MPEKQIPQPNYFAGHENQVQFFQDCEIEITSSTLHFIQPQ